MQAKLSINVSINTDSQEPLSSVKMSGPPESVAALLVSGVLDTLHKVGYTPQQFARVLLGAPDKDKPTERDGEDTPSESDGEGLWIL